MRALPDSGAGEVRPTTALDLFFVLFKWKWSILAIVTVALLSLSVWLFLLRGDLYVTESKLLVKIGSEQAPPSTVVGERPQLVDYFSNDVKSEVDILSSTELIGQLVDQFHFERPAVTPLPRGWLARIKYQVKELSRSIGDFVDQRMVQLGLREQLSPREKAIAALSKGLVVKVSEGANVVVADLALPARRNAGAVLNAHVDNYLRFRTQVYRDRGNDFFRKMLTEKSDQLAAAEGQLQAFENSAQISSETKQLDVLLEQISAAERARNESASAFNEAQSKVERLDAELKKPDPNLASLGSFDTAPFQRGLMTDLAQLEKKREEMRLTELDNSERMQNVAAQYHTLADMLEGNLRSVAAERLKDLTARSADVDSLQRRLSGLHQGQRQWLDLKRQVQSLEDEALFYRKRLEESTASSALVEQERTGNVVVIQRASDPVQAAGMRKMLVLGIGLIVAVCAALVYASIGEFFDRRIYIREQLERVLNAPVMGVVPFLAGARPTPQLLSAGVGNELTRAMGAGAGDQS
jgi:uncharacterized protein involved in exopolysaccharide biosynthesis